MGTVHVWIFFAYFRIFYETKVISRLINHILVHSGSTAEKSGVKRIKVALESLTGFRIVKLNVVTFARFVVLY